MLVMHGIRNCDSVRKARKLLDDAGVEYSLHDYKKDGADLEALRAACAQFGWEAVVNKRGTTWRKLDDATKSEVKDEASALDLMMRETSVIKRPLVTGGKQMLLGFDATVWSETLEKGEL